jgi:1-acyl-sn-glycerol-3-phosphate acyltransferase
MPVQALLLLLRSPLAERLPLAYHKLSSRILGFDTTVIGTLSPARPTLFVANHTSYIDIEILGGAIDAAFVAKSEVKRWPLFGWLARLQRTVFVDRRAHTTHRQRDAIVERLKEGGRVILFPEATSDDGTRVLPFKSALFAAVHGAHFEHPVTVQPVSIAYVTLDSIPIGRFYRPFFAWYGDMELASHLWAMVGLGRVGVTVEFHAPVSVHAFPTRKALAEHCWRVVAAGVASAIAGRPQPVEATCAVRPPQPAPATAGPAEAVAGS